MPPQTHVDYLNCIVRIAPGLDYKLLISKLSSMTILTAVTAELIETNVEELATLVAKIPYEVSGGKPDDTALYFFVYFLSLLFRRDC